MPDRENRFLQIEIRVEEEKGEKAITGYPIVFNQETDIGGFFREIIAPEAVRDEKILRDVALFVGHDFNMIPLARSRRNNGNSTMQLVPDEHGVKMRAVLDVENNPRAAEVYSAVKRGDISGMSFSFIVEGEKWEELDKAEPLRTITGFKKIHEVSLVAFPAYKGTSIQAASEDAALESARVSLESARKKAEEERAKQQNDERRNKALAIMRR